MRGLCWIILLVPIAACHNDGLARVSVSGSVTYDGAPVKYGLITFRPVAGSSGPAAGTAIMEGRFQVAAEKGPTVGPHEVEIKIPDFAKTATKPDEPSAGSRGAMHFKTFSQKALIEPQANEFHFALSAESMPLKSKQK
jgi:hypothetical protein